MFSALARCVWAEPEDTEPEDTSQSRQTQRDSQREGRTGHAHGRAPPPGRLRNTRAPPGIAE